MSASGLGLVQVYTGEGKGKTTAAIGQGIRCVGAGYKVVMFCFLKNSSSEFAALQRLSPQFRVVLANTEPRGFHWELTKQEKAASLRDHQAAWSKAVEMVAHHECDLLILDEVLPAVEYGLVNEVELLNMMGQCKGQRIELILTGRNMSAAVGAVADLITEMREIKHPMDQGIPARLGIEY